MKRVLFILPSLTVGGLERVQVTIANKLVQNGYDVTVMTLNPADDLRVELDKRVHYIYKPSKQHIGNRIPYIRHKFYDDGMWETRASARQLYDYYVGDEKFDVEIAFFRGLPVKIISGSPNRDAKHIAWVHSDPSKAGGFSNNFKSTQDAFDAYQTFDKVVCVSKQAAAGFEKAIGKTDNIEIIYNMLPVNEIIEKSKSTPLLSMPKAKFQVVLVGHFIDTTKGQSRLINSVYRLRNEGADISLALIGSGQDESLFRKMISDNHAEDYITIVDGGKNPYPYIKEADLLVCASYFEGYNLTVAEALILGTPVLSTNCTGPNEILDYGKYGMIVENSEEGLYDGLKQFCDNPGLLNEYKEKALQRQDFFDEDNILKQITNLF